MQKFFLFLGAQVFIAAIAREGVPDHDAFPVRWHEPWQEYTAEIGKSRRPRMTVMFGQGTIL